MQSPPHAARINGRTRRRTTARRCCSIWPRTLRSAPTSSLANSPCARAFRPPMPQQKSNNRSTGCSPYAAWADKFEGVIHQPPLRGVALAMNEALGVIGIGCPDEHPLLAFVSLFAPAIALGNRVVMVPSQACPLMATDFYQVVETSDVPAGVVNIVTGDNAHAGRCARGARRRRCSLELRRCNTVRRGRTRLGRQPQADLRRSWPPLDWSARETEGFVFLRQASQVKNIWIPYGD